MEKTGELSLKRSLFHWNHQRPYNSSIILLKLYTDALWVRAAICEVEPGQRGLLQNKSIRVKIKDVRESLYTMFQCDQSDVSYCSEVPPTRWTLVSEVSHGVCGEQTV